MEFFILNTAIFKEGQPPEASVSKELRRATRMMKMTHAVVQQALDPFPGLDRAALGVVLGTGHGELETTNEFLHHYRTTGSARPILFQNSLHNATLGFLSQSFGLVGPALTNSDHYFTGEKSLELAMLLLHQRQALYCLVIGIDALVPKLAEPLQMLYPAGVSLKEGCGAILMAGAEGVRRLNASPKATLRSISYGLGSKGEFANSEAYYDSDAIEKLARQIRPNGVAPFELVKPDGSRSILELSDYASV